MQPGKKINVEMQWAIIRLSMLLDNDRIAMCLNLSARTVRRVLAHFHMHGTIPNPEEEQVQNERKRDRHLKDIDVEVSLTYP